MDLVGARLKKIRLEKGITLEEAHKKTKIHLNILKAIEEGGVDNLNPVYIKGFIKIYCKFLGVDYKDYIPDYKDLKAPIKQDQDVAPGKKNKPISFIKSTSLKIDSFKPRTKFRIVFIIVLILVFSAGMFKLGKFLSYRRAFKSEKVKQGPVQAKVKQKSPVVKLDKKDSQLLANPTIQGVRVVVSAKDDCWMQVKVDGKIFLRGVLKKGRFETWQAKEKIELFLSSAGSVSLEANGKFFGSLGRKGQVLKDVVITREGLTVGQ